MMKKFIFLSLFISGVLKSQTPTMGLLQYGNGDLPGYVLFNPTNYTSTYLIDKCGNKIREWQSTYTSGHAAYLTPDGSLWRAGNTNNFTFNAGGKGGIIQKWDFNGNLNWSYQISSTSQCQHHDICPLPNGNVLALAWEKKTINGAIAQGRDPALLNANIWEEKVVEYQPTGLNTANLVWEWHAWNHLVQDFDSTKFNYGVVADHPELFNFNYTNGSTIADWMHFNGIAYDSIHDQILLSSRQLCEIYVIDHSTNTAQATSHSGGNYGKGGDILYRYGNPEAYNRGTLSDRKFYYQHCPRWIPSNHPWSSKISVFNNGNGRPGGSASTIDVINPPVDANWNYAISPTLPFGPDTLYWSYADPVPTSFFSSTISGAFNMSNGNFIVTDGQAGEFFEVDTMKNTLWRYKCPVNGTGPQTQGTAISGMLVFKATFYDVNFNGFNGENMTAGGPIELSPYSNTCSVTTGIPEEKLIENYIVYPNPSNGNLRVEQTSDDFIEIIIYDFLGNKVFETRSKESIVEIHTNSLVNGVYTLHILNNHKTYTSKVIIQK